MSIIRIEFQLLRPKLPAFKENNGHLSNGLSTLVIIFEATVRGQTVGQTALAGNTI